MNHIFDNNKGIALVLVLWVLALLSVLVGEFSQTTRTEINITRNFKEETLSYHLACSGINLAIYYLIFDKKPPLRDITGENEVEEAEFEWHPGSKLPPVSFDGGVIEIEIENESGKININKAESGLLKLMLNPFELEEEDQNIIVDSILDWRDNDEFHRLNGAESDYYQSLPNPYQAKNGDFDSIEELLLVRGITPEMYYGGLREMVTIYPEKEQNPKESEIDKTRRKPSLASNRININAASPQVLSALPLMTEDLVLSVMEHRAEQAFQSISQIVEVVGSDVGRAISPYISTDLVPQYTIRAIGSIPGSRTRRGVQAVIEVDPKIENNYNMLEWLDNIEIRPETDGVAF